MYKCYRVVGASTLHNSTLRQEVLTQLHVLSNVTKTPAAEYDRTIMYSVHVRMYPARLLWYHKIAMLPTD